MCEVCCGCSFGSVTVFFFADVILSTELLEEGTHEIDRCASTELDCLHWCCSCAGVGPMRTPG